MSSRRVLQTDRRDNTVRACLQRAIQGGERGLLPFGSITPMDCGPFALGKSRSANRRPVLE